MNNKVSSSRKSSNVAVVNDVGTALNEAISGAQDAISSVNSDVREAVEEAIDTSVDSIRKNVKSGTKEVKAALGDAVKAGKAATAEKVSESVITWMDQIGSLIGTTLALVKRHPRMALSIAITTGYLLTRAPRRET